MVSSATTVLHAGAAAHHPKRHFSANTVTGKPAYPMELPLPPPLPPAVAPSLKCHVGRQGKFNLRARRRPAEDVHLRANPLGAFANPDQPPVTLSPCAEYLLVDPLAIVTDEQPKSADGVIQFHLDVICLRVPEGVDQRLARNPVNLV